VKTRAEILKNASATRVWLPAAPSIKTPFQHTLSNELSAKGETAKLVDGNTAACVKPILALTNRVATKYDTVGLSTPRKKMRANRSD